MAQITGDWLPAVRAEFAKPYYRELYTFLQKEYRSGTIYPPADQIFNALHLTPLGKVKVVILGQDPYHNVHQARGLCFSVPEALFPAYCQYDLSDDGRTSWHFAACLLWPQSRRF